MKTVVVQSYYFLPNKSYDEYDLNLICASINNINITCKEFNIPHYFCGTKAFFDLVNLPDNIIKIELTDGLHSKNFDTIKIQAFYKVFNSDLSIDNVIHFDTDIFVSKTDFIKILSGMNLSNPVLVPWYEFCGSMSFRRQLVAKLIHDIDPEFKIHQVSRCLYEYNIGFIGFNKEYFKLFESKFWEYLKFIESISIDENLKDYILPFFPFQIGLYRFCDELIMNPILYDNTYLYKVDMPENFVIIRSTDSDIWHFGGRSKYSNECKNLIKQFL
jgi:hypothetical protein